MFLFSAVFFLRFCRLGRFFRALSASRTLSGSEGSIEAGGLETVFARG
jgi:hypothetical protein